MRFITLILFVPFWNVCFSQSGVAGLYQRQDSKIWLNHDSTFRFFYSVDTYRGWTKGTWSIKGTKIKLTPVPVYDTLTLIDANNRTKDSLIISRDETSTRLNNTTNRRVNIFQVEQNFKLCPATLAYKKRKTVCANEW
jgi:hypothetical protein